MATPVLAKRPAGSGHLVASPWHTLALIAVQCGLAVRVAMQASQLQSMPNPDRMRIYERTIISEWLVFGLMIAGVWLSGTSVYAVLGERWRSLGQVLRALGIGVLFLIATIAIDSFLGAHGNAGGQKSTTQFLLPHGRVEKTWWIALSITAGFCEEALYRGYFQRQFIGLTKSVPLGIGLSAVVFGGAHAYQGFSQALRIGILGMMGGILAYVCRSVRPGMIAHTLQDVLGGFVQH
jgi:membrane protease YdiL (CAAX protease family)